MWLSLLRTCIRTCSSLERGANHALGRGEQSGAYSRTRAKEIRTEAYEANYEITIFWHFGSEALCSQNLSQKKEKRTKKKTDMLKLMGGVPLCTT
jgi:hypothetical protein